MEWGLDFYLLMRDLQQVDRAKGVEGGEGTRPKENYATNDEKKPEKRARKPDPKGLRNKTYCFFHQEVQAWICCSRRADEPPGL